MRERPPGPLAVVLLLDIYLATLVWTVAHFHNLVFQVPTPGQSSYWPTLLFGIPALISGWLVSRFTPDTIRWASLATLALTAWTVANAFAAVAVAALKQSVGPVWQPELFGLEVLQPTWVVVMLSCAMALSLTVISLCARTIRYVKRLTLSRDAAHAQSRR